MMRKTAIVMDPIQSIKIAKDSSFALLLEAQSRGHDLYYLELGDLYVRDSVAYGSSRSLTVSEDSARWHELGERSEIALRDFDIILMRKDPPYDSEYLYATYILEQAAPALVVNRPQSLRDANEKLYAGQFAEFCPSTLVSRDRKRLKSFLAEESDIIVKPLDGMGGASIFRLRLGDPNTNVILETLTNHDRKTIMAQRYIPEVVNGDKRILLIDGVAVPYALARIPAKGETRANLATGGTAEGRELSTREKEICARLGPDLSRRGLYFVGIDVIGDHLTEINVTSPTGIRELDRFFDLNIASLLFDALEKRIDA